MFSQTHYLVRSKQDGQYLVARPRSDGQNETGFLLIFKEHYEALSYLNQHGAEVADRFGVESIAGTQLKGLLQRWGFQGVGLVEDPLVPQIQFLTIG
ncbi:MAG: hypothetical protein SVX43_07650 [Cyanobacteriota bacterium]|nr:hypothetical protein [Cyanobacteriota bacterium]